MILTYQATLTDLSGTPKTVRFQIETTDDHKHGFERVYCGLAESRCTYEYHANAFKGGTVFVCECGVRICSLCIQFYGHVEAAT